MISFSLLLADHEGDILVYIAGLLGIIMALILAGGMLAIGMLVIFWGRRRSIDSQGSLRKYIQWVGWLLCLGPILVVGWLMSPWFRAVVQSIPDVFDLFRNNWSG